MILFYSKNVKQIPIYFFNLCTSFIVSTLCCCAKKIPFKFLFNSSLEVLSINTLYFDKNIDDIFNLVKYSVYTTQNIFFTTCIPIHLVLHTRYSDWSALPYLFILRCYFSQLIPVIMAYSQRKKPDCYHFNIRFQNIYKCIIGWKKNKIINKSYFKHMSIHYVNKIMSKIFNRKLAVFCLIQNINS